MSAIQTILMEDNHYTYQMTHKELNIGFTAMHKTTHEELHMKKNSLALGFPQSIWAEERGMCQNR